MSLEVFRRDRFFEEVNVLSLQFKQDAPRRRRGIGTVRVDHQTNPGPDCFADCAHGFDILFHAKSRLQLERAKSGSEVPLGLENGVGWIVAVPSSIETSDVRLDAFAE